MGHVETGLQMCREALCVRLDVCVASISTVYFTQAADAE